MKKLLITIAAFISVASMSVVSYASTLHVSYSKFASWKLDCNVNISNNEIKLLSQLSLRFSLGSISNKKITINPTKANIRFTRHLYALTYHENVSIKLKDNKLYTTVTN